MRHHQQRRTPDQRPWTTKRQNYTQEIRHVMSQTQKATTKRDRDSSSRTRLHHRTPSPQLMTQEHPIPGCYGGPGARDPSLDK